jgi:orotate phosphoribosyltransferase
MHWDKNQIIGKLYEHKIILRKGPEYPDGFLLKSGKRSDIYINIRDLIKIPTLFNYIVHCLFELVIDNSDKPGSCIMGIPTMGAVIAPIIAYKAATPLAVIRQHKKSHGVGHSIEGSLTNKIIMIDDVITSGSSIKETLLDYVEPEFDQDYKLSIFVIIDREQHGLDNVHSLATLSEIRKFRIKK